jgi:hypothetical protein
MLHSWIFFNAMSKSKNIKYSWYSKFVESNKCIHLKNNENIYLSVSYKFSKFDGFRKIKVWHS